MAIKKIITTDLFNKYVNEQIKPYIDDSSAIVKEQLDQEVNDRIEDETARAIAKETQLEEAIATAGAVKDVKCDGTSIVVSKVADIGPSIDAKVLIETTRATAAEGTLQTNIDNETNRAQGAETTLTTNLATEVTNRTNADTTIQASITSINTSIQQLNTRIDNISISGDYAKKSDVATAKSQANAYTDTKIANVIEIANGKTKTYVLSYYDTYEHLKLVYENEGATIYNLSGENVTTEFFSAESRTLANSAFNSQSDSVNVEGLDIILKGSKTQTANSVYIWVKNLSTTSNIFNIGDIVLVVETNVPDRWVMGKGYFFGKMETAKVDLTNYVDKTSAETITGVKTFSNGLSANKIIAKNESNLTIYREDGTTKVFEFGNYNGTARISYSLSPYITNNNDLGNNTYRWKDLYLSGNIVMDSANRIRGIDSSLSPYLLRLYCGSSNLYITDEGITCGSGKRDLGTAASNWKDLYMSGAIVQDGASYTYKTYNNGSQLITEIYSNGNATSNGTILTDTFFASLNNGGKDLGSAGKKWKDLYMSGEIKSSGTAQYKKVQCLTQDEYDDITTKDENVLYLIKE